MTLQVRAGDSPASINPGTFSLFMILLWLNYIYCSNLRNRIQGKFSLPYHHNPTEGQKLAAVPPGADSLSMDGIMAVRVLPQTAPEARLGGKLRVRRALDILDQPPVGLVQPAEDLGEG